MNIEDSTEYIPLEKLWVMSAKERLSYLNKQWDLVDDCVYGQINKSSAGNFSILNNVKNINNVLLEYPFAGTEISNVGKHLDNFGIFAGPIKKDYPYGQLVRAQIAISKLEECERSNNPLLVEIKNPESVTFIPSSFIQIDSNGNAVIEESIKQFVIENNKTEINEQIHATKIELEKSVAQLEETESKVNSKNNQLKELNVTISDETEKKIQLESDINEEKKEFYRVKKECNSEKKKELDKLKKIKDETRQKMTQLKEYVQSKADFLRDLKLISEEQFNHVTGNTKQNNKSDEENIDFQHDLEGNFDKLIFQIQSYLYSKDRYYSKSTLQNFLTLLRTNDLIIISGPSGTGKSYLVNSFAQAIGGVAKIIPVKPNWTSSEDLLGYYNPIQKSYITTPFLDAIVAAKRDPNRLYLICLDEMNLARVEYYFADFLSVLEEREKTPIIHLYSQEEAEHIKSEFRTIIDIFEESRSSFPDTRFSDFGDFLHHKEITQKLHEIFGNNENNSLVDLYGKVRRMIGGILNIPAEFEFPANVRIIGTINIDQTTHYFAPKVLDRSYLLKFESPLANIDLINEEVEGMDENPTPVYLPIDDFWSTREPYPKFDHSDPTASMLGKWNKEFLSPLGIEVGMRVMRQALLFQQLYKDLQAQRNDSLFDSDTLNIILRTKILPHFMFDGDSNVTKENKEIEKHELVQQFAAEINEIISPTIEVHETNNAAQELHRMIRIAEHNDKIYNYWM